MNKDLLIPGSILAGCLAIALGVYLRPSQQTPTGLAPTPLTDSTPVAPAPRPPTRAATKALETTVREQAKQVLAAAQQATFIPKCWTPVVTANPGPSTSTYYFQITFDAQGKERGRAISERRGTSRPDVAICLRKLPLGLEVPPPGTPVRVELPLDFG